MVTTSDRRTARRKVAIASAPSPSSSDQRVRAAVLGLPVMAGLIDDGGRVAAERIADAFGMTKGQLAETVGLGRETFHKQARVNAAKTQNRLKEMLEIVTRVAAWAGGKDQAMAWYRAQPIAAFGDRTAEALVKSGQAAAVRDYLDHLALGGFA